ncbi:MAG: hypothetical protein Q8896_14010, partial [Bacteroidota bacterium]|nr:hypothetical protein [Bacteroidota bacterium]
MKRLFLLITLLLTFTVGISHAQWAELPALPAVLNWPMTAELNGTFYVFGGVDAAASTTVYTYTSGDANWKTLSVPMPKGKFGGYAAAANGKIYIVGGMILSGGNFVVDNTTYEFDPTAVTFTPKAAIPSKVAFFAGAQVGGKIYAIGGATSTVSTVKDSNVIQIYDPSADTWTRSASKVPYTTRFAASAVLNGTIYVMGGNDANGYLDKAFRGTINGTTITWDERASVPSALTRPSAGVANGTLVFTGGVGQASPAGYSNTYTYDESSDTWTTSYGLPIPTYNAGQLFGSGNDLYFAGGYANKRAFKFTVSTAKLPEAIMTSDAAFINLSPNQSRSVTYAVQNLGVAALDVNISFPDSSKSWLNSEATKVTIDPLQSGSYTLTLSSGTLSPGLYKSTVTVTTNDPAHATTLISVKLYVLPASIQTQPTVAVLEEGTGDWCGYCPQGAEIADNIKQTYGDNFIALEYHGGS